MSFTIKKILSLHSIIVVFIMLTPIIALKWATDRSLNALADTQAIYGNILSNLLEIDGAMKNSRFHAYAGFMHNSDLSVAHYHAHPFQLHLSTVNNEFKQAENSWLHIETNIDNTNTYYQEITQLKEQYKNYMRAGGIPFQQALNNKDWDSIVRIITAAIPEYAQFSKSIKSLEKNINEKALKQYETSNKEIENLFYSLVLIYVVLIILYLILSIWFQRRILSPLEVMVRCVKKMSEGDLNQVVDIKRQDEFGILAQAVEKMRLNLSKIIAKTIDDSTKVNEYSINLNSTSTTVNKSVETQMLSLANASSSLEQFLTSIEDISRNAQSTRKETHKAEEAASLCNNLVNNTEIAVKEVSTNLNNTSVQIKNLSDRVQQINSITNVIQDVAEQTNLLALNAAIEAARAGDQGRGFAVVADEVRQLAKRTTDSVDQIATMISEIQQSALTTVSSMNANCDTANNLVSITSETKTSINTINQIFSSVNLLVFEISNALDEQKSASHHLSTNVESIASSSEMNTKLIKNIFNVVKELDAISKSLKQSVSGFLV